MTSLDGSDGWFLGGKRLEFEFFHTNVKVIFFDVLLLKFLFPGIHILLTLFLIPTEKVVTPYLQIFFQIFRNYFNMTTFVYSLIFTSISQFFVA